MFLAKEESANSKERDQWVISPDYPLVVLLPFTDDPAFNRQSSFHRSVDGDVSEDAKYYGVIHGYAGEPEAAELSKFFHSLVQEAAKKDINVAISLVANGMLHDTAPDEWWENDAFLEAALKDNPYYINYMPQNLVTPEIFKETMKLAFERGGMDDGVGEILHNNQNHTFLSLLSPEELFAFEEELPGIIKQMLRFDMDAELYERLYPDDMSAYDSFKDGPI